MKMIKSPCNGQIERIRLGCVSVCVCDVIYIGIIPYRVIMRSKQAIISPFYIGGH